MPKGLVGLFSADVGDENHGEVTLGVKPDLGQVFAVGAAVGFERGGSPIKSKFAPAQCVFPMLGGAGFGPRLVRDSDNRGVKLP